MSQPPFLPLGHLDNSDLSTHHVHKLVKDNIISDTIVKDYEKDLLKFIALGEPTNFNLGVMQDISNDLNRDISIINNSNDSNIAVVVKFKSDTDVTYTNSEFNEKHNVSKTNAQQLFTNVVELDANTAPLYNANLTCNFSNSGNIISSPEGHYLSFDSTSNDCNFFKYANSKHANIENNSDDEIKCTFDNDFNHNHAFLTDKILERTLDNKISIKKDPVTGLDLDLGNKSIRYTDGLTEEFLQCEVLDSITNPDITPIFGSLKMLQGTNQTSFPASTNNISTFLNSSSTLSKLLKTTNIETTPQTLATTKPDTFLTEAQFKAQYSVEELAHHGPGYNFRLNINYQPSDGYNLGLENAINIPNYGPENIQTNTPSVDTIFTANNNNISENINYMTQMKDNGHFNNNSHSIYLRNGSLKLDPSHSANRNFTNFEILDGVEKLKVLSDIHKSDLEKNGIINVINTNNILGNTNARFRKYQDHTYLNKISTTSRINKLVVSYDATESDFREDTGIIHNVFKENYFVRSNLKSLNNSTDSRKNTTIWSNKELNAGQSNNSVLTFKQSPNSNLFNGNNISNFEAIGLDTYMKTTPEKFGLLEMRKTLEFSNESTLYKVSDGNALQDTSLYVGMDNLLDLISLNADDIRISLTCKKYTDLPQPSTSTWNWVTGKTIDGSLGDAVDTYYNNGYLLSKKDNEGYEGNEIFSMLESNSVNITFTLMTDDEAVSSQTMLSRKGRIDVTYSDKIITEIIEHGEKDIQFFYKTETTSNPIVQNLTGFVLPKGFTSTMFEVQKLTTTRVYDVAIKNLIGPYRNLWIIKKNIIEYTEWYRVWDKTKNAEASSNSYFLTSIKQDGKIIFKASRQFQDGLNKVYALSTTVNFKAKDFMGLKGKIEYKTANAWVPFTLKNEMLEEHSVDCIYYNLTKFTLLDNFGATLAVLNLSIDISENEAIGKVEHTSIGDNDGNMYQINMSVAEGTTSFSVQGRTYDNINDAQYFTDGWSPYNNDTFLLKNSLGDNVGSMIPNLTTVTEYIDPEPNSVNVNKVNRIRVTVKSDNISLCSFESDKYVLENFNLIYMPKALVKHEYIVNKKTYSSSGDGVITAGTEYLQSIFVDANLDIVNLKFGNNYPGIRAELLESQLDNVSQSFFELAGDRLNISLIVNPSNVENSYSGLYSDTNGEEIKSSTSGHTLPTNSQKHKSIVSKYFRGLLNDQPVINVIRKKSVMKMVITNSDFSGDIFVDNMDSTNNSTSSELWASRDTLISNKLLKVSPEYTGLSNMDNHDLGTTTDIGGIGFTLTSKYSMLPNSISSTLYKLPLSLNPSTFTKVIQNPSNEILNQNVSDNLFSIILHEFVNFNLVATRIKANNKEEKYNFITSTTPDLQIFYTQQYIGDPSTFTDSDWGSPVQNVVDSDLVNGFLFGVVKFTRIKPVVQQFAKYIILPKPIAIIEAYNVNQISQSLPHNFSGKGYTKVSRYIDINILDDNNIVLAANQQQHKPYDPVPPTTGYNLLNPVSVSLGVNNFTVGFNLSNYLFLKQQVMQPFRFQIKSNTLVIKSAVGLKSENLQNYTTIFEGLVEELNDNSKWHEDLRSTISNTFVNKKWNLKIPQLKTAISQFLDNPSRLLNENNIMINGITPFGIGDYFLNLHILDSVKIQYYKFNHVYDFDTDTHQLEFFRYSSAEGLPLNSYDMTKSSIFKPMIYKKDKFTLDVTIPNTLENEPYNVEEKIEAIIQATSFMNANWVTDSDFVESKSSFSFTTLSKKGAAALHDIFHVTNDSPLKVVVSKRPPILHVKNADGSTCFKINHDGKILTNNITTRKIELLRSFSSSQTILPYLNSTPFHESNLYQNTEN